MNIVHQLQRRAASVAVCLCGAVRLLLGTAMLTGLCVLLADPQAPIRWLGALILFS